MSEVKPIMHYSGMFSFFVLVMIVFPVDGGLLKYGYKMGVAIYKNQYKNKKSCIGNSTVQGKGMDGGCGCKKDNCEWLIQQKACPLACISKRYDANKASEEDTVATVYYNLYRPEISRVNEGEGTITLRFKISAIWEDNRIKAKFTEPERRIKLLPIIERKDALIWSPFKSTYYWGIKMVNAIK